MAANSGTFISTLPFKCMLHREREKGQKSCKGGERERANERERGREGGERGERVVKTQRDELVCVVETRMKVISNA